MISWMQKHHRWLVITIWVSTIAFIGAGFMGWGQYNYGKKATSVAKVGDVEISYRELQQEYGRLYSYFNSMLQGKFDEAQAKSFGLQKQALNQLVNQALILNLAHSYDLTISDTELIKALESQKVFYTNEVFDKELYKTLVARNNLSTTEYEADLRKQLLISKTFAMLSNKSTPLEEEVFNTTRNIADKIEYKVLDQSMIKIDTSDEKLKAFWETKKADFVTIPSYEISYIIQKPSATTNSDAQLNEYYEAHKSTFTDAQGKIKSFAEAKDQVAQMLSLESTKRDSLKTYIAFKKGELDKDPSIQTATISQEKNMFDADLLKDVSALTLDKAYLKPRLINNNYVIVKLDKIIPSAQKSFEEAKAETLTQYIANEKEQQLLTIAQTTSASFSGKSTNFITALDSKELSDLTTQEATEFLDQLFKSEKKRGFVTLSDKKIVLFAILEQKLLDTSKENVDSAIVRLKTELLNQNLIMALNKRYKTEIFVKGL